MTLILVVILTALAFEFINGFHDTANSIATVVATRVLNPRQAVMMAAVTNLFGALWGTAVASTIASGLIDPAVASQEVLMCALLGAIVWNLITWYAGLPSSSSHALVGGLVGAALAAAGSWDVVMWSVHEPGHWYPKGLLGKVIIPMLASPLIGFFLAFLLMGLLFAVLRNLKPRTVNTIFGKAQLASAMSMGFMHGTNDAQKTMGIIALALAAATADGRFETLPAWLHFLHTTPPEPGESLTIATWIKLLCAVVMAAGTASGGWRIIKTLGHKMVRLQPVHGFAAETTSALIIGIASHFGFPVSTTHTVSAAIMGVGAAKRFSALKWTIVERMVWAWVLTIPISATIAYLLMSLMRTVGYSN